MARYGAMEVLGPLTVARDNAGTLTGLGTLSGAFTLGNGSLTLLMGNGAAATNAGTGFALTTGTGNTTGAGGPLTLLAGGGGASGNGGPISLQAGDGGAAAGSGGSLAFTAGVAQANGDDGGGISLVAGAADAAGEGGSVRLVVGLSPAGLQGVVVLAPPAGGTAPALQFFEDDASGTDFFSLQAAAAMAASTPYTWPNAYPGVSGMVLASTTAGVMSWAVNAAAGGAQLFRADLTEAGSDDFVINTGFGNAANEVVDIVLRDDNNNIVLPDLVTFDAVVDQVTINLASYRAANGGTLPAGFRVLAVG